MANGERNPFVPGFREDIFISYAHIDDQEKWVRDLHTRLDTRLRELLGPNLRTWRDLRLHDGDALWETLEPTISGSAVFVAILSPSYVLSRPCLREATFFHETAKARGAMVGTTCRFVQVVKTPFEHQPDSRFLGDIESIQSRFYVPKPLDEPRFTAFPSRDNLPHYGDFYTRSDELAQSLAGILQKMRARLAGPEPRASRVSVFLARTTADRREDHAFVAQEIGDLCNLRPTADLPLTIAELTTDLSTQLSGCALAVHLVGSSFGILPEGEVKRSLPWVQLEQASGTRRLVWIPEDLAAVEERQQSFLKMIEDCQDPSLEVVYSGLPDFVQHLKDVLAELSRPVSPPVLGKAIYVVSDALDLSRQDLRDLRNCILGQGFRIEDPVFEEDQENLRLAEEKALRDSNAVLLYWGDARDTWVKERREAIRKALANLENGARYRRAVYLGSPERGAKGFFKGLPGGQFPEDFGPPLLVLGDCGEFACAMLDPLLRIVTEESRT